jgi:hypothetical protein
MKKVTSAVSAFVLMMTLTVGAFAASNCCHDTSCCTKGAPCCQAKK